MDKLELRIKEVNPEYVTVEWDRAASTAGKVRYRVFWSDRYTPNMEYKCVAETVQTEYVLHKSTHIPHYLSVSAEENGVELGRSEVVRTPVGRVMNEQRENLGRGLIAVKTGEGVFLSWRLFVDEVTGYSETGMTGTDFVVFKNGERLALVSDSTNYLDREGRAEDSYTVAPVREGRAEDSCAAAPACAPVKPWPVPGTCVESSPVKSEKSSGVNFDANPNAGSGVNSGAYMELPLVKPADGVTPAGDAYSYSANDMSVGDVDGDGEYEFFVKWEPSNARDVSQRGYTGNCLIDCYKLDGRLLWRLDMGKNIRAGAHYTQFIVYDFDGDGRAEMSVKTAPGTCMTVFGEDGSVKSKKYITLPEGDVRAGVTHKDNYVCNAEGYYRHMKEVFSSWQEHPMVRDGQWPGTLEECFGIEPWYRYPLSEEDARALTDYFMDVYAPSRSSKNKLREVEGFIYEGPEYLTMFAGDGRELETIAFPHPREDDGLMWGDYAFPRIEPCNRVDRFLSGVAYLDGERPYLIVCRGYYTRTTIVAYDFFEGRHRVKFDIDSGHVPLGNPFFSTTNHKDGCDPVYGVLTGQGNHSLSVADVDGDGRQEIIYGAAVIDHDGSLLYSSKGYLPDGRLVKLGHGDSMHVAVIDPDRPGYQIFNVFEEGKDAPYGWALRDAETGESLFGEYAEVDLGRCMIGDVSPNVRGLSVWVDDMYDCKGNRLPDRPLGTNASIRWAADLTTQILDGADYMHERQTGVINDNTHGVMLKPEGTLTNNSTKGNPCLVADIFGDFREELLLRTADSSAIRIYTNTEITGHKLFTLMHDIMYRTGVAWQNNCYNQPCYTKFYYAGDMDFSQVLPWLS